MDKQRMTDLIVSAKSAKKLDWETIAKDLNISPYGWLPPASNEQRTTGRCHCHAEYLELDAEVADALEAFPTKIWSQAVPTDPLIYRLYEVVGVYGETLKEVIQEKFGDGIMSAIDFSMEVEKIPDPKGDRVLLTMNGKFLPYNNW